MAGRKVALWANMGLVFCFVCVLNLCFDVVFEIKDTYVRMYSGLPLIRPPLGPIKSGGVASFLGGKLYYKAYFGTFRSGLNTGVAAFQGSRLEGVHCMYISR